MADKKKTNNAKKTNNSGNSKQKPIKIERSEIIRWAVGFVAFFIILTFIPAINNGWLGNIIATFLKGLFGPMYYVVPFLVLIIDILWGRDHANNVARVKYVIYALEFVFISILMGRPCSVDIRWICSMVWTNWLPM